MDERECYRELFEPLEAAVGRLDADTSVSLIGFDAGGPLNFCTIASRLGAGFTTYVSCELAVRDDQHPSDFGRYELLVDSDDEDWVRTVVSEIGRMSLDVSFQAGDTLDIGPWVDAGATIQGVTFERVSSCRMQGVSYGVMRVIGVTRQELELARQRGTDVLHDMLRRAGVYP